MSPNHTVLHRIHPKKAFQFVRWRISQMQSNTHCSGRATHLKVHSNNQLKMHRNIFPIQHSLIECWSCLVCSHWKFWIRSRWVPSVCVLRSRRISNPINLFFRMCSHRLLWSMNDQKNFSIVWSGHAWLGRSIIRIKFVSCCTISHRTSQAPAVNHFGLDQNVVQNRSILMSTIQCTWIMSLQRPIWRHLFMDCHRCVIVKLLPNWLAASRCLNLFPDLEWILLLPMRPCKPITTMAMDWTNRGCKRSFHSSPHWDPSISISHQSNLKKTMTQISIWISLWPAPICVPPITVFQQLIVIHRNWLLAKSYQLSQRPHPLCPAWLFWKFTSKRKGECFRF